MLIAPQSNHWYQVKDGVVTPCYEIPRKDGKGIRAPKVDDARELGLWPSVTNVLGVLNKPGLEAWKQEQAILAALTLPRLPDEPIDAFAHRVAEDMSAQSEKARDKGTAVHAALENFLLTDWLEGEADIWALVRPTVEWLTHLAPKIHGVETYISDPLGYAGRLDLLCQIPPHGLVVVDFKTQKVRRTTKDAPRPEFYPEFPLQLAAYAHPLATERWPLGLSVVINTERPEPPFLQWYELPEHWGAFQNVFRSWCYMRKYTPEPAPKAFVAENGLSVQSPRRPENQGKPILTALE